MDEVGEDGDLVCMVLCHCLQRVCLEVRGVESGGARGLDLAIGLRGTIRPETNSNDFGVFWNNQQIRIRISSLRKLFFFERFEFLVCSKFNHMQRDCKCACAVACLPPHNSNSNVVVSVTNHDNI